MRKILLLFLLIILSLSLVACGSNDTKPNPTEPQATEPLSTENEENSNPAEEVNSNTESEQPESEPETDKILVAYFSYSGNTKTFANQIHEQMGGDIFEIKTTYEYPTSYNDVLDQAQSEKSNNDRPELNDHVENMEEYEIIFIGYPNWWGDMPMAVYSFLDDYDLSGKTVIPFCTHGGSGFSNTINSIKNTEPDATILDGLAIRDSGVNKASSDITEWLNNLEIID